MNETVSLVWLLLKVAFFTIILVFLAFVLLRYGLPYMYRGGSKRTRYIEVVEVRMITREHILALIRLGNRFYLLGLTKGKICLIAVHDDLSPNESFSHET